MSSKSGLANPRVFFLPILWKRSGGSEEGARSEEEEGEAVEKAAPSKHIQKL